MKRLVTKWFLKWSKKVNLTSANLLTAIDDLEEGKSVADLGCCLYKVRVKREHSGKSSGYRTIILYKAEDRAIFLYGYGKNERNSIDNKELQYFKKLAGDLLSLNSEQLERAVSQKILYEVESIK